MFRGADEFEYFSDFVSLRHFVFDAGEGLRRVEAGASQNTQRILQSLYAIRIEAATLEPDAVGSVDTDFAGDGGL